MDGLKKNMFQPHTDLEFVGFPSRNVVTYRTECSIRPHRIDRY